MKSSSKRSLVAMSLVVPGLIGASDCPLIVDAEHMIQEAVGSGFSASVQDESGEGVLLTQASFFRPVAINVCGLNGRALCTDARPEDLDVACTITTAMTRTGYWSIEEHWYGLSMVSGGAGNGFGRALVLGNE